MKKILLSLSALMLLALGACNSNNEVVAEQPATNEQEAVAGSPMTIEVGRNVANTKITVDDDDMSLEWSSGDAIGVKYTVENATTIEKFTLVSGAGSNKALFRNESSALPAITQEKGNVTVAIVYPYSEDGSLDITSQSDIDGVGNVLPFKGESKAGYDADAQTAWLAGCTLEPQFVILKVAIGTLMLLESQMEYPKTIFGGIVMEDLSNALYSQVDSDGQVSSHKVTLTTSGAAVSPGNRTLKNNPMYFVFALDDTVTDTPVLKLTYSVSPTQARDAVEFTYKITRDKTFTKGKMYTLPEDLTPYCIINFADENVKSICVTKWDTNGDGELTIVEAAAVESLGKVFEYNTTITSFDELKYFTGLTSISAYAFDGCTNLASVTIPENVTSIGMGAFRDTSLKSITTPESCTELGAYAFTNCTSLTTVNLLGVTTMGHATTTNNGYQFQNCSSLATVNIYKVITQGAWAMFYGVTTENVDLHLNTNQGDLTVGDYTYKITTGDNGQFMNYTFKSVTKDL